MTSRPQSKESKSKKKSSVVSTSRDIMLNNILKKTLKNTLDPTSYNKPSTIYSKPKDNKLSTHHSRKLSARRDSVDKPNLAVKKHTKNNSTSIQHGKTTSLVPSQIKNTFKIDLSTLIMKQNPTQYVTDQLKQFSRNSFIFKFVLGSGGFGRVWSVELKKTGKKYAMKQMLKTKILCKNSIHSVLQQLRLLTILHHPFLVNIFCAFNEREYLYLAMDHLTGGDLRYHISVNKKRKFKESEIKFALACCILGVQYLHKNNVIHRDIKPQNLIFDKKGFLRITDLGIAKILRPENKSDTSGTPGYMAPEVMIKQNHSFTVDYYAIGIIAHEFMLGRRPYQGQNKQQILQKIRSKQAQVTITELPKGWQLQSIDFINRLIQRRADQRLGYNGIQQLKQHPWLKGFPWQKLLKKEIQPTYIPKSIVSTPDYRAQISSITNENIDQQNRLLLRFKQQQANLNLLEDYHYYPQNIVQSKQIKQKSKQKRKISKKHSTGGTTTGGTTHHSVHEQHSIKKNSKKSIFFQ